ncbi:general transcription factor 3C polypeptide 1-like isoform X2 [Eriocheir sinensis]|uniref:general transcription factor 3C polypeptide 1-like isoform X2 n=1 Tax=Eriocheir sinensis TaxID=95602 RepID=UPI0021C59EE5|nr:general transcription factor 3C polypeptide 1-like isoform X2 [Eriocheir sinensis]
MAPTLNYVADLEDEVALEGLDGITVEGLWLRLKHRPNFESNMPLDDKSKIFLWSLICRNQEISMYKLPTPRRELVIFNRYEHMDHELGIVLEPADIPADIYPFHLIEDTENGIRGSCATYHERIDVTETVITMSLEEVEEMYGRQLVLVASPLLRDKALCISACIDKFYDLTISQYVILERIGRSRWMGEITQGKVSLASMGENPKTMFYHRKRLLKLNLITKQPHQQKGIKGQTNNGSLLHLTRFYVERHSKFIMMIQRAVELLMSKPNHCAPYSQVKEEMGIPEPSCRKLFKSTEFQRLVRNVSKPYRKVYPNATAAQWKCKGKDVEKFIRMMELIDPGVDPLEVCKTDEAVEEEEEEEMYPGILDQSKIRWREDLLHQAYKIVEEAGPDGVTQSDMARMLGQAKLDSRTICRNLQRCNTVHSLMKDVGRQRVSRYVSHKFIQTGHLTQEFRKERQKMIAMIEHDKPQGANLPSTSQKNEVSKTVESNLLEGVEVNMEVVTMKKGGKENCDAASTDQADSTPSSSFPSTSSSSLATPSQAKQGEKKPPEGKLYSEGFLSLLKEMKMTYNNQKRSSPHVTTRMMKRANMIIEAVRSTRVIDDAFRLQKMIVQAETKEGYAVKMDKKSLDRLLDKLSKEGFLKNIIVKLKSKTTKTTKEVRYVVHPSITFDNPHLISTIEQQKLKFLVASNEPKKDAEGSSPDKKAAARKVKMEDKSEGVQASATVEVTAEGAGEAMNRASVGESMHQLKLMNSSSSSNQVGEEALSPPPATKSADYKKQIGIKTSLGPKFMRKYELHKLLFYLVYGYQGSEDLCQEDAWVTIAEASPEVNLQNEDMSEYPNIYYPELSYKMFIPPLPKHMNTDNGWAFVCDVLLRLPLCIFVRLVSVPCMSPELESFLCHPLRKNLLVKYLPQHLRQNLLQGRRYVTYVIDLINRLCYMGLLQYGQQVMKEKDQVFIYVNRHASLIDSTISSPGYHQISTDKEYVRKEYYFNCLQDILQYWYDLWTISMHTPLGGHNCMQGKKITIQILDRKPQILETLAPRSTTEAPLRDTGVIPGDGRGAGGLDSAMFAHLKRNWSSSSQSSATRPSAIIPPSSVAGERANYEGSASYSQYLMNTTNPSAETLSPKHRLAGLRNVKLSVYRPRLGPDGKALEVPVGVVSRQPRGRKRRQEESQPSDVKAPAVKSTRSRGTGRNNQYSYQRELKQRKKSPKKPYYDEEDRAALRRMNKLRVDWSSAEDSFLLLCKVASCFLFPNVRSQMITFSLVRDLLHERFPEARNKTSRACQRRINYIMKNATTEDNVSIFLEEVRQDASIVSEFKSPKVPRNKTNLENVYSKIFRELMNRLVVKFASSDSRQCPDLPSTLEEFEDRYQVIVASSSLRSKLRIKEVTTIADIDFYVVNALIYSSLCSKYDRDSYAYQLYLAYQQYPHTLLNSVLTRMRQDQMISYKKAYNRSVVAQSCLPLSTSPFQLSVTYQYVFNFKYQYEIFGQAWQMLKQLVQQSSQSALRASSKEGSPAPSSSPSCPDVNPEGGSSTGQGEGVPILIHQEGGYCAAIVALLATKRLIFNIVIPEQIIMMDQQHTVMQDHHESLLQRFSDHTQLSGRDIQDFDVSFTDAEKKQQLLASASRPKVGDRIAEAMGREAFSRGDASPVSASTQDCEAHDVKTGIKGSVKRKVGKERRKVKKLCKAPGTMSHEEDKDKDEEEEGEDMEVGENTFASNVHKNLRLTSTPSQPKLKVEQVKGTQDSVEVDGTEEPSQGGGKKKDKHVSFQDGNAGDAVEMQDTEDTSILGEASSIEEDADGSESQGRSNLPSASRLGLYMMRDQLTQADVNQINIQHAQEHLVVNACDITCRLRPPPDLQDEYRAAVAKGVEAIEDVLLPLPKALVADALEKRRKVTLQGWNQLEDVLAQWEEEGHGADLLAMVRELYQYIDQQKELGASVKDLKTRYRDYPYNVTAVVALMEGALLLLRVGASTVCWVTMQHTKPWLIQTNKITRMNRQSIQVQGVYKMNLDKTGETPSTSTTTQDSGVLEGSEQEGSKHGEEQDQAVSQDAELASDPLASSSPPPGNLPGEEWSASAAPPQQGMETESQADPASPPSGTELDLPPPVALDSSTEEPQNQTYEASTSSSVQALGEGEEEAPIPTTADASEGEPTTTTRRSRRISQSNAAAKQGEEDTSLGVRHIHSFLAMRKRNYKRDENVSSRMEKTVQHHYQTSEHERIDVAVRPWVRLNGTLNRRVVDRLLGAALCLVMERPGISGRDIVCRFSPALQPAHTHDLLETLVQLQCVVRVQLVPSHKPSLFSDIVDYSLVLAEVHDCDEEVLYEPTVDAILKLSMFIGEKKYTQDFLSGERR